MYAVKSGLNPVAVAELELRVVSVVPVVLFFFVAAYYLGLEKCFGLAS